MSTADNVKRIHAEKVVRIIDLSLSTAVKTEYGTNQNPTIDTLSKIAKVLGVSFDDLLI